MSLSGRFSPYTRYCLQREISAPTLNRMDSFEDEDDGEGFAYFLDEDEEQTGRQTSIGFVHTKQMSASMSSLHKQRPQSEMQRRNADLRYRSTPNFIKINKKAVIGSGGKVMPMNPRVVLQRQLNGVLKVYNNTNIQRRTFSLDNIFSENGLVDPNMLSMPIDGDDLRSQQILKQQVKSGKKRLMIRKKRLLSPIEGTPNKDPREKEKDKKRDGKFKNDWDDRFKKDKFGRVDTPKKPGLPNFRNTKKSSAAPIVRKKKSDTSPNSIEWSSRHSDGS